MNSDLRQLKALVDDLTGPLGPMSFDRAVRRYPTLLEGFRAVGYTWSQIARALAAAGIQRPDGGAATSCLQNVTFCLQCVTSLMDNFD